MSEILCLGGILSIKYIGGSKQPEWGIIRCDVGIPYGILKIVVEQLCMDGYIGMHQPTERTR